jgi:hypothetical protein
VDLTYFSIPDGLKFKGQRALFKSWEKALTPTEFALLQESAVGEVDRNRDHNRNTPFLHVALVQDTHDHGTSFLFDHMHLDRR